jgi:hypothetical protein
MSDNFFDSLRDRVTVNFDNLFGKFKNIFDKDYDEFNKDYDEFENIKNKIKQKQETDEIQQDKFKNKFCDDYVNYLDKQINNMMNNITKDIQYDNGKISKSFHKSMYYDENKQIEKYQYFPVDPSICEKKIIDFMEKKYGSNRKINLRFHKWDSEDAYALGSSDYFFHTVEIIPSAKTINIKQYS